ncbi:uncharacterized protein GVI51_C02145 [Nakaseomyces glabratus]|uniref:Uncharacterized protein n=2 Tax=Candida glabrata TaxID=5478 RepID=Q6FWW5_CANGA|nr:uncharacterized protein CAGL0C02365g [Nakaseomyces glabratus]KAH7590134.1 hypothetical protein J7298_00519 [Nakaseomyces glabratus]KAH7591157.1 hypothetical protein J7297_00521 [Nakaseomyces glabratus]KAH7597413.1 hypothetical protein J7296_00517 [Nakaseomyces glabratus]KAH7607834.1 hypothetical protein J7295_00520 [Nakaseomyces glabratus]KAH7608617.1 hypothetical protein J7293_00522 [Nakaseomyces glabratus]|eukprot:XP_445279.1 uncharacterized protein CAGL0C02365g [[Candida] glabrata]
MTTPNARRSRTQKISNESKRCSKSKPKAKAKTQSKAKSRAYAGPTFVAPDVSDLPRPTLI